MRPAKLLLFLAVWLLLLFFVYRADGATLINDPRAPVYPASSFERMQRWVDESRVPTVPGTIRIALAPSGDATIEASALPNRSIRTTTPWDRFALMHELGHELDYYVLTWADRSRLQQLMHTTADRDWLSGPATVFGTRPANELAADAYAACALYRGAYGARHNWQMPPIGSFERDQDGFTPGYNWRPGPRQFRQVCALFQGLKDRSARQAPEPFMHDPTSGILVGAGSSPGPADSGDMIAR